jgi:site-specific recombinase XerD
VESVDYWMGELANKSEGTRLKYRDYFGRFVEFLGKTADQLLAERNADLKQEDPKQQRRIETSLKRFIAHLRESGNSPATQQVAYAAVRSFFEMHYLPLRMRRGDYPTGESNGQRAATKDAIRRVLSNSAKMRDELKVKAIILTLKDSGLRVSDLAALNYGDVADGLEKGDEFISLTLVTKKQRTVAKTFLGPESIEALREYLEERRKGTRRIPPEIMTRNSPLFRTNEGSEVKRLSRSGLSSMLAFHFKQLGEKRLSAHSFRKFLQTQLEAAGVNPNWIDQILGHKLINSRDAYSLPSDQQLRGAYEQAYSQLKVFKSAELEDRINDLETQLEEKDALIRGLMSNGVSKNSELEALRAKVESIENSRESLTSLLNKVLKLEKKLNKQKKA